MQTEVYLSSELCIDYFNHTSLFSRLIPLWYSWYGLFPEISFLSFLIKYNKHILSPWKKCASHGSLNHHVSRIIQLHPHVHLTTKPSITKTPSLLTTAELDTVTWTKRHFIMSLLSSDLVFLRYCGTVGSSVYLMTLIQGKEGFPGGSDGKESAGNTGDRVVYRSIHISANDTIHSLLWLSVYRVMHLLQLINLNCYNHSKSIRSL